MITKERIYRKINYLSPDELSALPVVEVSREKLRELMRTWEYDPYTYYVRQEDRLPGEVGRYADTRIIWKRESEEKPLDISPLRK